MGSSPRTDDFEGTERFAVLRRVGEGAMGVVYEAEDRERHQRVALKTLRRLDAQALYRFKNEFRALQDVSHPNLATPYELICADGHWFVAMEYVEGVDFLAYVRPGRDDTGAAEPTLTVSRPGIAVVAGAPTAGSAGALDLDRLRPALRQLADAIQALHAAGKVHRDVKPSNVLVTADGRVRLLDFGLVAELERDDSHRSLDERIAGTPAYMAPEQGRTGAITPAADWYAFGVMLFQALTGHLPFTGTSLDVLLDKQQREAAAPSELCPSVPADLDALCRELLRIEARARPPGPEVVRRLAATAGVTRPRLAPGALRSMHQLPFVGRERQLAQLEEAFGMVRSGKAATVYVHGGSGAGKSALVRHFLDSTLGREEAIVLGGRCYERESVPYKAFDSLIDSLARYLMRLERHECEAVLPVNVLPLARLFPVLRQVEAVAEARRQLEVPDPLVLRRRAFSALRELLARLTTRRPVILHIDDLQWSDVDSSALLAELLRPPDPPPLLLVATYRDEEAAANAPLQALLEAHPPGSATVADVFVGLLPHAEAAQLARALAGPDAPEVAAHADRIAHESGGHPYLIHELVRHAAAGPGALTAAGHISLDDVLRTRFLQLPDEARQLLEVISVAGQPLEASVAGRASEVRAADQALMLLRAGHLVRSVRGRGADLVEAYHDRIRETVVRALTPERLAQCHHRLALALERSEHPDPEALAIHFLGAGLRDRAGEHMAAAAGRAADTLAFDRAAALYRQALELVSPEDAVRAGLRGRLGESLANAGRGAEAARAYLAAVEHANAAEALELQRRAADQFLRAGHINEGLEVLRRVLAAVGMKLPRSSRSALLLLLWRRLLIRLRGLGYREVDASEVSAKELTRIDICWSVSSLLSSVDTVRGQEFQTRHLLLALSAGEPYRVTRALSAEAGYLATAGGPGWPRASRIGARADELATRLGNPQGVGNATMCRGIGAYMVGDYPTASTECERAAAIFHERCTGVAWEIHTSQIFTLGALFYLGELAAMATRIPGFIQAAVERGDRYASTSYPTGLSSVANLVGDDPAHCRRMVDDAIAHWSEQGFHLQHYWAILAHCQIDLYTGDGPAALERLSSRWAELKRSLLLMVQQVCIESLHLRARALVASARQHPEPAPLLRAAERDARRIARKRMAWATPLVHLIRAAIATQTGAPERAVALCDAAAQGFEGAGMKLYAAAARWRRGELVGGDEGRALVESSTAQIRAQRVASPTSLVEMLAPGFRTR